MTKYKVLNTLVLAALLLAACGGQTATVAPTTAPGETAAAPTTAAEGSATPGATLKEVARNRTVILGWSITSPIGVTNPWSLGYTHQEGNVFLWEPLEYYGIFASKEIPWLADSMDYNADFTQLTIKLNKDAAWSDGQPLTSKDVAFTFDTQMNNDKMSYHADFQQFVKDWTTPDAQTVIVNFKLPAPRFKYEVLTFKFDTGIPIVPEHVLGNTTVITDVTAYQGGLDMPHSGPYTLVAWDANQKIYDLRSDWWAVKAGREPMPQVERIVMVNIGGQVGGNMDTVIQRLVNNEFDAILDVRASVIAAILKGNPKVTSWTGNDPPGGYLDWWPNSLWMNDQIEPYNDPNVRKAIALTIDRDKIDTAIYDGAKVSTIYPFPLYPNLQKFADSAAVKAQEALYNPREFNLDKSAELFKAAGFTKNGDGLWEKDGQTISGVINGFEGIHSDLAPVLVEMLRAGGVDASVNFGTDAYQNMADGKPGFYLFGHGASTIDPYAALNLYNSAYSNAVGTTAGNNRFSRYKNPEYDALLDIMAPLGADDPKFQDAAAKALGIYWKDTIDIPIIQWLHRIPYNQTYWTNWPLANNQAMGTNGAFWAETGMLVITGLKPAQ